MQTKLTLRLDDNLIARAKAWAAARGVSLSEAVAELFSQLPHEPTELSTWTQLLVGAGGASCTDADAREAWIDAAARKHV
jgi:hypothetical protein